MIPKNKAPAGLMFILISHLIFAFAFFGVGIIDVFRNLACGSAADSIFGFASGSEYAVFNVMSEVIMISLGLFAVLVSAAGLSRLFMYATHHEIYRAGRSSSPFYLRPEFWCAAVFSVIFLCFSAVNLMSCTQFEPMLFDSGEASALILMLFGPILALMLFGVALVSVGAVILLFVAAMNCRKLFFYIEDCIASYDEACEHQAQVDMSAI